MLYLLIAAYIIFWSIALTVKYLSLGYFDWDLAFFNQAIWNLLHGNTFSSLFNINFFGNHGNFITFVFLPLYALLPNALFLIYLKVIFMALAAVPLFLIARDNLNYKYGLLFALLYFLYPGLNYAVSYEFDWENLSVFFIMWMFYFYYRKNFLWFCLTGAVLLAVKENMSFMLFMSGIYALLQRRSKRWVLSGIIPGAAWFCLYVFLLAPHFTRLSRHIHWGNYPAITSAAPFAIIETLFNRLNLEFLIQLFWPVLFISFLSPVILALGTPFFLQHMFSKAYSQHTVYFGYSSSLIPFIFVSAVFGMAFLIRHCRRYFRYLMPLVIISLISCALIADFGLIPLIDSIFSNARHELNQTRKEFLRMVPKDSSVIATFAFLPYLSGRRHLYAFEDLYYHIHYGEGRPLPPGIEYALVDFNDFYLAGRLKHIPSGYGKIADFLEKRSLGVVSAVNDIVLFKSGYPSALKLFEEKEEIDFSGKDVVTVGGSLEFAFDAKPFRVTAGQVIPLKFYWFCVNTPPANYGIRLSLADDKGSAAYTAHHAAGYRIRPTSSWLKGKFMEESYNFLVPPLPQGKYFLRLVFFDCDTARNIYIASKEAARVTDNTVVDMGVIDIDG